MIRTASAVWRGDLPSGSGTVSAPSGILDDTNYSFKTRFEEGVTGTNPEELIAAAHASCYSMAFSHGLASAGHTPTEVSTKADVTLEKVPDGFSITKIHLTCEAVVPGISTEDFDTHANAAKEGCPVSKVLNADISLTATLKS